MHPAVADQLRAIAVFEAVLAQVSGSDLGLPTPCGDWTVRDLLEHQLGQDLAFTAALRGGARDVADWVPVPLGGGPDAEADPSAPLRTALREQRAALNEMADPADRPVWMPEIRPDAPLPAARALAAHQIDLVVHGWDLAVSVDAALTVPDDLLARSLAVARAIPDTAESRAPGRAFTRGLAVPAGVEGLDELLRRLGRDPGWAPPTR